LYSFVSAGLCDGCVDRIGSGTAFASTLSAQLWLCRLLFRRLYCFVSVSAVLLRVVQFCFGGRAAFAGSVQCYFAQFCFGGRAASAGSVQCYSGLCSFASAGVQLLSAVYSVTPGCVVLLRRTYSFCRQCAVLLRDVQFCFGGSVAYGSGSAVVQSASVFGGDFCDGSLHYNRISGFLHGVWPLQLKLTQSTEKYIKSRRFSCDFRP